MKKQQKKPKCLGIIFPFGMFWYVFVGCPVLSRFLAICSVLELKAAISTIFALVCNSNLSFAMVFACSIFWC